jgi:hypothetical protein
VSTRHIQSPQSRNKTSYATLAFNYTYNHIIVQTLEIDHVPVSKAEREKNKTLIHSFTGFKTKLKAINFSNSRNGIYNKINANPI